MTGLFGGAMLMLAAWLVEALFGYPDWLYRRIRHPVVWLGALIDGLDRALNRPALGHAWRVVLGAAATAATVALAVCAAVAVSALLPESMPGFWVEAIIASSLICSRSLYSHVDAVSGPLAAGDLPGARAAVAHVVGRETAQLPPDGVARAALESLAENTSDGVVAPLFWGVVFGLPGLAAYKAVNTLDSMIGHRDARHAAFGRFAAHLDDAANYVPARLTGLLFALASFKPEAFAVMWRDARRHRSSNAGWPEGAAAGALDVRLSGPRSYGGAESAEPWLNARAGDPGPDDLRTGLGLYCKALFLAALVLAGIATLQWAQ